MAEAIARHHLDQGLLGKEPRSQVFVASAGVQAPDGVPISIQTIRTLQTYGIDHQGRSKPLTAEMIRKADLVLCMTESQQSQVREMISDSPENEQKVMMLDPGNDVEDPIGAGQSAYDALGKRFWQLIPRRLKELLGNEDRTRVRSSR